MEAESECGEEGGEFGRRVRDRAGVIGEGVCILLADQSLFFTFLYLVLCIILAYYFLCIFVCLYLCLPINLFLHLPYIFLAYQSLFTLSLYLVLCIFPPCQFFCTFDYLSLLLFVSPCILSSLLILSFPLYLRVSRPMYVPKLSTTMYLSLSLPISLASIPVSYVYLSCLRFSLSTTTSNATTTDTIIPSCDVRGDGTERWEEWGD